MSGRKKDLVWKHFIQIEKADSKTIRAKCNKCHTEIVGLVARMRKHLKNCDKMKTSNTKNTSVSSESENSDDIEVENTDINPRINTFQTESENYELPSTSKSSNVVTINVKSTGKSKSTLPAETQRPNKFKMDSKIDKFVIKTTEVDKNKLHLQIARYIFATNTAFNHVEHPEFKKLIEMLRPGYKPPNRQQIGNTLLEETFNTVLEESKKNLKNKVVCMSQDGWTNIRNEAIVCTSVTDMVDANVYLVDTVDTMENSHTADYLLSILTKAIKSCQKFGCTVGSVVTDNAANMVKMRAELAKVEELGMPDILTYGCSAHLLNLLAHDMDVPGIKEHVKKIIKYFKYTHFAAAMYKSAGGKALVLPQDVRWNTLCRCLESYLDNWHILSKICSENRIAIDMNITNKVHDINLKVNVQDYHLKLKKIQMALDQIQSDTCTISQCTHIWLRLIREFESQAEFSEIDKKKANDRFNMAMTPAHYLAYLLDHRFRGEHLNNEQLDSALDFVNNNNPDALPDIISYRAGTSPFKEYLFSDITVKNVIPLTWWMSLKGRISEKTMNLTIQLHTAVASSAGLERLFSSFGLIHSKLRNRLGTEKASKLVAIMRVLNKNNVDAEDE